MFSKRDGDRAIGCLSASTALAQAIAVLASPVLTRIFSPDDFGCLSVFAAFLSVASIICSFRYDVAITQGKTEAERVHLLYLALLVGGAFSVLLLGALLPLSGYLSRSLDAPQMRNLWWFVALGTFSIGAYNAIQYFALANKNYTAVGRSRILQGIINPGGAIALGMIVAGPIGLLIGNILAGSAGATAMYQACRQAAGNVRTKVSDLWVAAKDYKEFPLYGSWAALFNATGLVIVPILLARLYSVEAAGFYGLAFRVISVPINVIGLSVGQVYLAEASAAWRDDKKSLMVLTRSARRRLLPLSGAVLLGGLAAPFVFPFVFGKAWETAGLFAAALCLQAAAQLYTSPISSVVYIVGRQKTQLVLDVLRLALLCGSLFGARYYSPDPLYAVAFSALTMTVCYAIYSLWYVSLSRNGESRGAATTIAGSDSV
ncbi:MAG TPA: oligosaccharide flippase family protein [Verrucomicrobiae bacterium]